MNASYTVQYTPTQRDLMTADEMRRKSNELAILIIEGENAVKDEKYNMKNHPNYYMIAEGENLTRKKSRLRSTTGAVRHSRKVICNRLAGSMRLIGIRSLSWKILKQTAWL